MLTGSLVGEMLPMDSVNNAQPTSSVALPVLPRSLRQALAFLRANFHLKVALADVASACGLSQRAVQKQFESFLGVSPMAHLSRMRLTAVHDQLRQSHGSVSISEVASRCGINHMGRFAVEYRKVYGELPSRTLRNASKFTSCSDQPSRPELFSTPSIARQRQSLVVIPLRTETLLERRLAQCAFR
jgi:transcriptional regulator GlxA family with amidase domain